MEIKATAGDLAYLMEEISKLSPINIEDTLEIADEEQEKEPERSPEVEVKQILLEKLKEMAEIEPDDYMDGSDYVAVCSVMNDIAKTLLDK